VKNKRWGAMRIPMPLCVFVGYIIIPRMVLSLIPFAGHGLLR